jgi:hypothetical protein
MAIDRTISLQGELLIREGSPMSTTLTRRGASQPYDHRGTVVVASAWLVFYVIIAVHHLMISCN